MEHTWKMLKITCITRRMGFILYVPVPPTLRSRDYLARFKGLICLIHLFPVRCRLEIFFLPPQCIFFFFFFTSSTADKHNLPRSPTGTGENQ